MIDVTYNDLNKMWDKLHSIDMAMPLVFSNKYQLDNLAVTCIACGARTVSDSHAIHGKITKNDDGYVIVSILKCDHCVTEKLPSMGIFCTMLVPHEEQIRGCAPPEGRQEATDAFLKEMMDDS